MHSRGVLRMTVRFFFLLLQIVVFSTTPRLPSVSSHSTWWRSSCRANLAYRTRAPRHRSEFIENDKEITLAVSNQTKDTKKKKKTERRGDFRWNIVTKFVVCRWFLTPHNCASAPRDETAECAVTILNVNRKRNLPFSSRLSHYRPQSASQPATHATPCKSEESANARW